MATVYLVVWQAAILKQTLLSFLPFPKETPFSDLPISTGTVKYILGLFKCVSFKNFKIKYVELFTFSDV